MDVKDIFTYCEWACTYCMSINDTPLILMRAKMLLHCATCGSVQDPSVDKVVCAVTLPHFTYVTPPESKMPTKPVSFRSKLLAFVATAPLAEVSNMFEDAREVVSARKRMATKVTVKTVPAAKPAVATAAGKAKITGKKPAPAVVPDVETPASDL